MMKITRSPARPPLAASNSGAATASRDASVASSSESMSSTASCRRSAAAVPSAFSADSSSPKSTWALPQAQAARARSAVGAPASCRCRPANATRSGSSGVKRLAWASSSHTDGLWGSRCNSRRASACAWSICPANISSLTSRISSASDSFPACAKGSSTEIASPIRPVSSSVRARMKAVCGEAGVSCQSRRAASRAPSSSPSCEQHMTPFAHSSRSGSGAATALRTRSSAANASPRAAAATAACSAAKAERGSWPANVVTASYLQARHDFRAYYERLLQYTASRRQPPASWVTFGDEPALGGRPHTIV